MTVQVQDSLSLDREAAWIAWDMVIVPHPSIWKLTGDEATESCGWTLNTACHRHFLASWEIKDDRLYLLDVIGGYRLVGEEPLFAEWYSGTLRAGAGEVLRSPRFGYDSLYEREFEIEIENGMVLKTQMRTHDGVGRKTKTNADTDVLPPCYGEVPGWIRER